MNSLKQSLLDVSYRGAIVICDYCPFCTSNYNCEMSFLNVNKLYKYCRKAVKMRCKSISRGFPMIR